MESDKLLDLKEHFYNPLFTDFYQITMAHAYWVNGLQEQQASFEAFFWECPFKGKFAIFAGLDEVVKYLRDLKFREEDIDFLKERMGPEIEEGFWDYLRTIDGSKIRVTGIKEGTIVFG